VACSERQQRSSFLLRTRETRQDAKAGSWTLLLRKFPHHDAVTGFHTASQGFPGS